MAPKTQIILGSVKQLHVQIFGKETFQLLTHVCVCNKSEYSEQDTAIILNYGTGYFFYGNTWSEFVNICLLLYCDRKKNSAGSFWSQEDSLSICILLPVYLLLQQKVQFIFFSKKKKKAFDW